MRISWLLRRSSGNPLKSGTYHFLQWTPHPFSSWLSPPPLIAVVCQVGDLYGLKGERVRQIEGVAMKMLKKGLQQGLRKTLIVQHAD